MGKWVTTIFLAIMWGVICGNIFTFPVSLVFAFFGGASIGWFWPKIYDRIIGND